MVLPHFLLVPLAFTMETAAFQYLPPCRHIEALHEDGIPYAPLSVKSVYLRSWPRINKAA